jgi:glycosyltransferase involved in cell wall biosynthesis
MKIAIDITPIKGEMKGHKVRGVGFYLEYLKRALVTHFPEHDYTFFARGEEIPSDIDIVHYPYFEPFFITLPLIEKHKRVITVHDLTPILFPHHFPAGIKGNFRWQVQRFNLKNSAGIITDSQASQKDIIRITGIDKKKVDVAYLAGAEEFHRLEPGKWRKKLLEKYNLPEKFVLYVGDITWNKNIPRLVEAIKEANLTLVMVGKSLVEKYFDHDNKWNKDLIKVQKAVKDDKRFIRLGFVPTDDLVALYNTATVFVFPSVYEGFGLPILESMQSGCPTIISKEGCMPEVGGDAAFYFDGYNTNSLANAIGEVFYTPKLQKQLTEKGLKQAEKFSWKKTAEQTINAYKKAVSRL